MKLSICIPTYNRSDLLLRCLDSIFINVNKGLDFNVIVSDNHSNDETFHLCKLYYHHHNFSYFRNDKNIGVLGNFIKVINYSNAEFAWLLGDDDLLLGDSLTRLFELFSNHPKVDFFYLNSYNSISTSANFLNDDSNNLYLPLFSNYKKSGELKFMELINRNISFDFLGGMYMSVFRQSMWKKNLNVINQNSFADHRVFSNFDNTFPHVKIFSYAFSCSKAYFSHKPFTINFAGARDWAHLYPLIYSVRIPEALDFYRKNGLNYFSYLKAKNSSLDNFALDYVRLIKNYQRYKNYFSFPKLVLMNCLFPNVYLSLLYPIIRKFKKLIKI